MGLSGPACYFLTLLHSEKTKLYTVLAFLSAVGLRKAFNFRGADSFLKVLILVEEDGKNKIAELLPLFF